ncbi:sulfate adenylyltransferase subunit 1 [Nonomuraea diastatica]|uniref:sulfate adenylyltransferase n=1 Tax=Nonomuraea diastatica TaxID=1848329 RepID=A0A4R4WXM5_9ACTN|nr:GTP-binding protein [Nonomuraea diastatica]TDD22593.1 sulfate adenylyltransferase [Nonomuraea diastatica]
METTLLRFATAGSVDDGKSTLVGRLLYDTKTVLADQLEAIEAASRRQGHEGAALALLTDGLRAEREQGITIDVAYRYFATPRRRFILADTPGHVQYTRNMVTGASGAELVLLLVDVRKGISAQTRRHAAVAALLRVPHVVLAVNKMDLAGFSEDAFAGIAEEFTALATRLGIHEVTAIPVSALTGDNVATPSPNMDWYGGPTVLELLETVPAGADPARAALRLPVQYVIRAGGRRAYAGQIAGGVLRAGERVTVLPSGRSATVSGIDVLGTSAPVAWAPQSVAVALDADLDVSRGDLIVAANAAPELTCELDVTVCHLHDRALALGERVLVKHGTRTVQAVVEDISPCAWLDDLTCDPAADVLAVNEIGEVLLRTAAPLAVDPYAESRTTGACLLIDPDDGSTRAAGVVRG